MPNAPPAEHVAYFRELFRHLDKEYMALVADYEMLKPTMEDVELCRRFSRVPETAGGSGGAERALQPVHPWHMANSARESSA